MECYTKIQKLRYIDITNFWIFEKYRYFLKIYPMSRQNNFPMLLHGEISTHFVKCVLNITSIRLHHLKVFTSFINFILIYQNITIKWHPKIQNLRYIDITNFWICEKYRCFHKIYQIPRQNNFSVLLHGGFTLTLWNVL